MGKEEYAVLEWDLHHSLVPESMEFLGDWPSVYREFVPSRVTLRHLRRASGGDMQRLVHVANHVDEEAEHEGFLELPVEVVRVGAVELQSAQGFDLFDGARTVQLCAQR